MTLCFFPINKGGLIKKMAFLFEKDFSLLVVDKAIFTAVKTSFDKFFCGRSGIEVMGCVDVALADRGMTGDAGGGAGECGPFTITYR